MLLSEVIPFYLNSMPWRYTPRCTFFLRCTFIN